jgi:hypothetical protein
MLPSHYLRSDFKVCPWVKMNFYYRSFQTVKYSSTFSHLGWVTYSWKVYTEQNTQDWKNKRKSGRQKMSYYFHKFKARLRGILTDLPQHTLVNKIDWTNFAALSHTNSKDRRSSTVFFFFFFFFTHACHLQARMFQLYTFIHKYTFSMLISTGRD